MKATTFWPTTLAVVVALIVGTIVGKNWLQPAFGVGEQGKTDACCPRYSVVFTEGTNLCVTDNQTQTVYYYTIDPEKKPGAPLHLRGSVDLRDVGKEVIQPKLLKQPE